METNSRHIINLLLCAGAASCIYYLSLLCGLPLAVPVVATLAAVVLLGCWMFIGMPQPEVPKYSFTVAAVALWCIYVLGENAVLLATKHGSWDAWGIWNFHARYLADGAHWKNMFRNTVNDHPDYPLGLPSLLAFAHRLSGFHFGLVIPFVVAFIVTISTPLLVFAQVSVKNRLVALVVLYLFAQDKYYITQGMAQYADTLLALFFLGAIVCLDNASSHRRYIAFSMALLGCCMWTKNEGMILGAMFVLFNAKTLCSREHRWYALAGIALPVLTLLLFKATNPVHNDMVHGLGANTLHQLTNGKNYHLIYDSFVLNLNERFHYLKVMVLIYLALCLLGRRAPDKRLTMLLCCLGAYMGIYLTTTHGLEWHLATSQDRLMHQLMPAVLYVLATKATGISKSSTLVARYQAF